MLLLFAAAGLVAGIAILAAVPPTEDSYYPRCQLHSATGLHCPGCGTTRAIHAFFNGRFEQALAYNAIAIVVLPILAWSLLKSLWYWYRNVRVAGSRSSPVWPWVIAVLLIGYGVARNLPWEPFSRLAPQELKP